MSPTADAEYFSGMTEEIINSLAAVPALLLRPLRGSSFGLRPL
jgi:hypothetical protein